MFTRHYPYGEIEPFTTPRFAKRKRLNHYRADLPVWLDRLCHQCVSDNPTERPQDSMELAFELEQGLAGNASAKPAFTPLLAQNPLLFWQVTSGLLLVAWLATLIIKG